MGLCSVIAQVYKFIRLLELDIQKHGEFLQVAVQVLMLLSLGCFTTVLVRINQQVVYHLTERSTHKTRLFDKEAS